MSTTKKEKKFTWNIVILFALSLLIGAMIGYLIGEYIDKMIGPKDSLGKYMFTIAIMFLGVYFLIFLNTIIHEAGHLIFGLITGYRFFSFRIGSLMWIKENNKIRLKRFLLPGTAGQCLMLPPENNDGKTPFVLYNLGGSFLNITVSIISLLLYFIFKDVPYLSMLLFLFTVLGFYYGLVNGIPLRLGMIDNDGYNTISFAKDKDALKSFRIMMKVQEYVAKGTRLKDMPEEWFVVPNEENMKNSITATLAVFAINRLMDKHDFEKAKDLIERILSMDSGIVGLHSSMLTIDLIYCELLGDKREDILLKMLDKKQQKFMKSMKNNPSVLRTQYAYALLAEKDEAKALSIKEQFEKCARTYPYAIDIESERELIEIVDIT